MEQLEQKIFLIFSLYLIFLFEAYSNFDSLQASYFSFSLNWNHKVLQQNYKNYNKKNIQNLFLIFF